MMKFGFVLLIFLATADYVFGQTCVIGGQEMSPIFTDIYLSVEDIDEGPFYLNSTENIVGSRIEDEQFPSGFQIEVIGNELTVNPGSSFADVDNFFASDGSPTREARTHVVLRCADSAERDTFFTVNIIDTNNNPPTFNNDGIFEYLLPSPFPSQLDITWIGEDILVNDIDFSNLGIIFAVDNENFDISWDGFTDNANKISRARLVSKQPLRITEDIVLKISATDNGSLPFKTAEATVTIKPNPELSLPASPQFANAYHEADYNVDGDVHTLAVSLPFGHPNAIAPTLTLSDETHFSGSIVGDQVEINLIENFPEDDIQNRRFVVLVVSAEVANAETVARTVVIVKFPEPEITTQAPTTETTTECPTPTPCEECTTTVVECTTVPVTTDTPDTTTECSCPSTETTATTEECITDCSQCFESSTPCPETTTDSTTTEEVTECSCPPSECTTTDWSTTTTCDCETTTESCPVTPTCPDTTAESTTCDCSETTTGFTWPSTTDCPETTTECNCPTETTTQCPETTTVVITTTTECPIDVTTECNCPTETTTQCPETTTECNCSTETTTQCPETTTECNCSTETTTQCPETTTVVTTTTEYPDSTTECCECTPTTESTTVTEPVCPDTELPETTVCDCTTESTITTTDCPIPTSTPGGCDCETECPIGPPPEATITYDRSTYIFNINAGDILTEEITATSTLQEDVITYTINPIRDDVMTYDSITGTLTVFGLLESTAHWFTLTATGSVSKETAEATLTIRVGPLVNCDGNLKTSHTFLIKEIEEHDTEEIVIPMIENDTVSYHFEIVNVEPTSTHFCIDAEGHVVAFDLDREDGVFDNTKPQYLVTVKIADGDHTGPSDCVSSHLRYKKSILNLREDDQCVIMPRSIENNADTVVVAIVITDINDNQPEFEGTQMYVGYPKEDILPLVSPQYIAKAEAFDIDAGENATLVYSVNSNRVAVNEETGHVYPTVDMYDDDDDFSFTVSARDQHGEGFQSRNSLTISVKFLDINHISILSLEDVFLEDVDEKLNELGADAGITIKYLTSSILPINDLRRNSRAAAEHYLVLTVYAFDGNQELITTGNLQELLENESGLTITPLPDSGNGNDDESDGDDNGGLIAGIVVLAILLALAIAGFVAFYFLFYRKKQNYSKMDEDGKPSDSPKFSKNQRSSSNVGGHSDVDVSKRRPTGYSFGGPTDEDEATSPPSATAPASEATNDELKFERERKKSVVFNVNVEEVDIEREPENDGDQEAKDETKDGEGKETAKDTSSIYPTLNGSTTEESKL